MNNERPLPLNVQVAMGMGWEYVPLSDTTLPHFWLPNGETMVAADFTPDLDPESWYIVERWMVRNFNCNQQSRYSQMVWREADFTFDLLTLPFSIRCKAFVEAVKQ